MNDIKIVIITSSKDLPNKESQDFFQSNELFRIVETISGLTPYLVVAYDNEEEIARMMVMMRRRGSLVPPYLFTQARVYGEGEYVPGYDKQEIFGFMLRSITKRLIRRLCLYIEFSHMSTKMFAYREFRDNNFFPLRWMQVRNSLHSMAPEKRLTQKTIKRLINARKSNIETLVSNQNEDFAAFYKILKSKVGLKIRRFIPNEKLFLFLIEKECSKLFITKENDNIIGGCICVYSQKDCYLWFIASKTGLKRKRSIAMTVWKAIKDAYDRGFHHISFMDVGLPFRKSPFREFILDFGGKPEGTYRWFRCSIGWINSLLSWIYKE